MVLGGVKPNSIANASGSFTTMLMKACKIAGRCWALLGSEGLLQYTSQDLQSVAATATQMNTIARYCILLPHLFASRIERSCAKASKVPGELLPSLDWSESDPSSRTCSSPG